MGLPIVPPLHLRFWCVGSWQRRDISTQPRVLYNPRRHITSSAGLVGCISNLRHIGGREWDALLGTHALHLRPRAALHLRCAAVLSCLLKGSVGRLHGKPRRLGCTSNQMLKLNQLSLLPSILYGAIGGHPERRGRDESTHGPLGVMLFNRFCTTTLELQTLFFSSSFSL